MSSDGLGRPDRGAVEELVVAAIKDSNELRSDDQKIVESVNAPLFGGEGPLDSLGLVSLLMDVEESLLDIDIEVSLSSEHAMSQKRSPYRSVDSLVDYILDQSTVT